MKKKRKKLELAKETLASLESVRGGDLEALYLSEVCVPGSARTACGSCPASACHVTFCAC